MQYFEAFNSVMYSWWSAPLGNVRVLPVFFARIAFSSLQTWPVSELKVASGKPNRKHCSKRISQEQEEKENSKKSRPLEQMPHRRAELLYVKWSGIDQSDIFRQWSQTQLDGIAHEQTIICRQLFAGHVMGSRPMKRKKNFLRMIIEVIIKLKIVNHHNVV